MNNGNFGQIITFYSYKGGTGRSMALANVACVLANTVSKNEKVLMIDWDLEAPGLHRFFDNNLKGSRANQLDKQKGLIDLFIDMKNLWEHNSPKCPAPNSFFEHLKIEKYILDTDINNLFLMTAGKFDNNYPARVNTFNWETLFNANPLLIPNFASYLAKHYRYVLIDSRTGFSDISNVCTALMPEKLVLVFTPNLQSLTGALDLAESVTHYRRNSDDTRPLIIYPLVSRVENAEQKLQKDWRYGNKPKKITGYQPQFESILRSVYDLDECDLTDYFDEMQIQYVPRYSFGEDIAVLSERSDDRLSLARSYENFVEVLAEENNTPWEFSKQPELNKLIAENKIYIGGSVDKINDIARKAGGTGIAQSSKKTKIFISHSSIDKAMVRDLYERLAKDGYDAWFDEEKLLPGQDWIRETTNAILSADAIIVCLSSRSVSKDGYIQKEIVLSLETALQKQKGDVFILPVRFDDCDVPALIRNWHYVDFFPKPRKDLAYDRLRKSLQIREESITKS